METDKADARRRAWTAYWKGGNLHSCADSYGGNYSGAIGHFWDRVVAQTTAQSRVLDLATGNGALPMMFQKRHGWGETPEIHGIDQAAVAPDWYRPETHPGVHFHAGVAMEQLPFADRSFDLVVSQFGLEYARWPEALAEMLRVVDDQGAAALVLHHPDSILMRIGQREVAHQRRLLASGGLLDAADDVLPWIVAARSADARLSSQLSEQAIQARLRYNAAMQDISVAIEGDAAPDLLLEARDVVHLALASAESQTKEQQQQVLDAYRAALQVGFVRTQEMIEHAVPTGKLQELLNALAQRWPTHLIESSVLSQEQGLLGWAISASWPRAQG